MPKILYLDCFSGVSGDMMLGALLDLGLPLDELRQALGSLAIEGCDIGAEKVTRAGVGATKFRVDAPSGDKESPPGHTHSHSHSHDHEHSHHHDEGHGHEHPHTDAHSHDHHPSHVHDHRSLPEIYSLIDGSALSAAGKNRAQKLFARLAEAEAFIHQMPVEKVHLHEVGALDSIIDIVGAVFGLEWVGADRIVCSPLNVGGGMVRSAHGVFPVPAPATVRLLKGVPVYSSGAQAELVTPTGALLVTEYASGYGPVPAMTLQQAGYGAGERDPRETPNVLRILVGETRTAATAEPVLVIEFELDDMNPQIFGVLMDRLYGAGALEVFFSPVQMKKNRPGTVVTIIAHPEDRESLTTLVFRETTTIGLRYHEVDRERLDRASVPIDTPLGKIRFKIARRGGEILNASPEFDDCARIAAERGLSVKNVLAIATKAYLEARQS